MALTDEEIKELESIESITSNEVTANISKYIKIFEKIEFVEELRLALKFIKKIPFNESSKNITTLQKIITERTSNLISNLERKILDPEKLLDELARIKALIIRNRKIYNTNANKDKKVLFTNRKKSVHNILEKIDERTRKILTQSKEILKKLHEEMLVIKSKQKSDFEQEVFNVLEQAAEVVSDEEIKFSLLNQLKSIFLEPPKDRTRKLQEVVDQLDDLKEISQEIEKKDMFSLLSFKLRDISSKQHVQELYNNVIQQLTRKLLTVVDEELISISKTKEIEEKLNLLKNKLELFVHNIRVPFPEEKHIQSSIESFFDELNIAKIPDLNYKQLKIRLVQNITESLNKFKKPSNITWSFTKIKDNTTQRSLLKRQGLKGIAKSLLDNIESAAALNENEKKELKSLINSVLLSSKKITEIKRNIEIALGKLPKLLPILVKGAGNDQNEKRSKAINILRENLTTKLQILLNKIRGLKYKSAIKIEAVENNYTLEIMQHRSVRSAIHDFCVQLLAAANDTISALTLNQTKQPETSKMVSEAVTVSNFVKRVFSLSGVLVKRCSSRLDDVSVYNPNALFVNGRFQLSTWKKIAFAFKEHRLSLLALHDMEIIYDHDFTQKDHIISVKMKIGKVGVSQYEVPLLKITKLSDTKHRVEYPNFEKMGKIIPQITALKESDKSLLRKIQQEELYEAIIKNVEFSVVKPITRTREQFSKLKRYTVAKQKIEFALSKKNFPQRKQETRGLQREFQKDFKQHKTEFSRKNQSHRH